MEDIPAAHRSYILKFFEFLLSKSAAVRIAAPLAELPLQPVHDSLLYLRAFVDDPAAAFGRFACARILLAARGYALISAIKTLACLGARRLTVLQTGAMWHAHELRAAFGELARWPDAALDIVMCPPADATYVVHCADDAACPFERLMAALPDASHLIATVADGQLCALRGADLPLLPTRAAGAPLAPPDGLCAGATAAMLCFDDLCGVRPLPAGRYLHFGLDADVPMNSAGLYPLLPFDAGCAGAQDAIVVADRIEELVRTPLSPLRAPVERTAEGSCIKLYTFDAQLADGTRVTLAGAGLTRAQCTTGALLQLAAGQRHWFCHTAPDERAAIADYLAQLDAARNAVAALPEAASAPTSLPTLSAREQYFSFCINATFGVRVHWTEAALAASPWSHCTLLSGGAVTIFLPHHGAASANQREAGLLALYAALWLGDARGRDVVLADEPLQPREAP